MATPDDLEEFRACQIGYRGRVAHWNDLSRGAAHWVSGPDAKAREIGLMPVLSGVKTPGGNDPHRRLGCGPARLHPAGMRNG
jgi:hypothetical protein